MHSAYFLSNNINADTAAESRNLMKSTTLDNIEYLLKKDRRTWYWLSKETGIPDSSLRYYRAQRKKDITLETAVKIANALGVSLNDLVDIPKERLFTSNTVYNIKYLLQAHNKTWHELSENTDISESIFQEWRKYGITNIPIEMAVKIAEAFQVTLYELIHTNMWSKAANQEHKHMNISESNDWTHHLDDNLCNHIRCMTTYIDECLMNFRTINRKQCMMKLLLMFETLPKPSDNLTQKIDYQTLLFEAAKLEETAKYDGFIPFLIQLRDFTLKESELSLLSYGVIYYNILRILRQIPEDIPDDNRYIIRKV